MKHSILHGVLPFVVAVLASCAQPSKPPAAAGPTGVAKSAPDGRFEGTISKIDVKAGLITVQHWPLSKTFDVPPECEIDVLTNANAVLAQLKTADPVVVTYSEVGDHLVANRIAHLSKAQDKERNEKLERLDKMLNPSPNQ